MPLDERLAQRVRQRLGDRADILEKKMFGGLAFLLNGNMSCGVHGTDLIVRMDHASAQHALAEPGARVFDLNGRPMRGWLLVSGAALGDEQVLDQWVRRAVEYAATLPRK